MVQSGNDFNAVRIALASPDQVKLWSYGEVTKPETINYRTLRPEKEGLFCERIFGPTKDWECYCGKYKKIRYKGVVCDRCGVEVARSKVRRERMGHIALAAPVAHIWMSKGIPSRLGILLDISPRNLERVLYFAQYLVMEVDDALRHAAIEGLERHIERSTERLDAETEEKTEELKAEISKNLESLDAKMEEEIQKRRAELVEGLDADEKEDSEGQADEQPDIESIRAKFEQDKIEVAGKGNAEIEGVRVKFEQAKKEIEEEAEERIEDLEELQVGLLLTESRYRDLHDLFGEVFSAGMGAEAILKVLQGLDLDTMRDDLQGRIRSTSGQRRKKAIKTLRIVEAFRKSDNKPEWMILTMLPVLPPELRPLVQLDGGRFATSDLNDLYRRVINRNNRLRRLIELQAPEIIVRNEKRMLQEAVDALIDNGRRGRPVPGSHKHKLKSLSDLLRGKQGRFRQNLLGKRVDYSGRSVITVGPNLKLHECGLPRRMALELFKPFVMNRLVLNGHAHNIKSAKRLAESARPEVWDILENIVAERPVLLNRAPTLHRLGIQAFQPILVDGGAIQVHPLVCLAFNADFDGDQMAVHVPLSKGAVQEAKKVMLSSYNMLSPSSGEPIVAPTLDMAFGCYYLTMVEEDARGAGRKFAGLEDARLAYEMGSVDLRAEIGVRHSGGENGSGWMDTTVGRIIFNDALPDGMEFRNGVQDKDTLKEITSECFQRFGNEATVEAVDSIKNLGFQYASKSGTTIALNDIAIPAEKAKIVDEFCPDTGGACPHEECNPYCDKCGHKETCKAQKAGRKAQKAGRECCESCKFCNLDDPDECRNHFHAEHKVNTLEQQYLDGLITPEEKYRNAVKIWTGANDELTDVIDENMKNYGGIYLMAVSGAKGNIAQIKQMAGMQGLMASSKGHIIDRPIKSNFREGLSVLEYFISTHGARKGLTDTALRTADSGYLTRRLVDVGQEVTITMDDCGTVQGFWVEKRPTEPLETPFEDRVRSRTLALPVEVVDRETGEIEKIADSGDTVDDALADKIASAGVEGAMVRSPLMCEAIRGLCKKCYGPSLASGAPPIEGEAVGIIAAQSIGEPGTQLTMRTFHTGGIAERGSARADITGGLPRVVELFEARNPKGEAVLSEIDGVVETLEEAGVRKVVVRSTEEYSDEYELPEGYRALVDDGDTINIGDSVAEPGPTADGDDGAAVMQPADLMARVAGTVHVNGGVIAIEWEEKDEREYVVPAASRIIVGDGDKVAAGDALTAGPKSPQQILRIQGGEVVQRYLIEEVQKVYLSQGVMIHDKHIEVVVRQMMRKVRIEESGDTNHIQEEYVGIREFEESNESVMAEGGEPATASPVLLGITRASLNMESFLAAASFQETTRVLTESAINGSVDNLRGLKENVIIGRLIPARFDISEEGRERLGLEDHDAYEPMGALAAPLAPAGPDWEDIPDADLPRL